MVQSSQTHNHGILESNNSDLILTVNDDDDDDDDDNEDDDGDKISVASMSSRSCKLDKGDKGIKLIEKANYILDKIWTQYTKTNIYWFLWNFHRVCPMHVSNSA